MPNDEVISVEVSIEFGSDFKTIEVLSKVSVLLKKVKVELDIDEVVWDDVFGVLVSDFVGVEIVELDVEVEVKAVAFSRVVKRFFEVVDGNAVVAYKDFFN